MIPLILASTSKYRQELMDRLNVAYKCQKPAFDEDSAKSSDLPPRELCQMLGSEKARSLATDENCVIGSDQMCILGSRIFHKPGSVENAVVQLSEMQGKTHELLTSVSIFFKNKEIKFMNVTRLTMKNLDAEALKTYVALDLPLDCAGSYKIEKHGISLFSKIESDDFTAIQGLPLLRLAAELGVLGYQIPGKGTRHE